MKNYNNKPLLLTREYVNEEGTSYWSAYYNGKWITYKFLRIEKQCEKAIRILDGEKIMLESLIHRIHRNTGFITHRQING